MPTLFNAATAQLGGPFVPKYVAKNSRAKAGYLSSIMAVRAFFINERRWWTLCMVRLTLG